jgi:MFS family permease
LSSLTTLLVTFWSYKGAVLGACTLAFFATMAARLVISPVVPLMGEEFAVSNGALGLALSGMWAAYAGAQFPSGLLADRFGERRVILVAVGGTAGACILLAAAPTYGVVLVGAVVLGGVAGLHYSVATSLLTRQLPNTGSAIGIHTAGAPVAGLLIPAAAGAVGAWLGWRWAVALGSLIALPAAVIFAKVVRPTPPARPDASIGERVRGRGLLRILTRPAIAVPLVLSACGAFVWQATASFLPAFLVAYHGYSDPAAGALFSVYFAVQGVVQPVLGGASDRVGRYPAVAAVLSVGIGGYVLLVVGSGLWVVVTAIVGAGVAMSWGAALLPVFMDHLAPEERSVGFGLIRTTYMVLGAGGSVVTGVVADGWGWGAAVFGLVGLQAAMLLGLLLMSVRTSIVGAASRSVPTSSS